MKNIYVFFSISLILLSLQSIKSQITLTNAYNPVIGDIQKSFTCDTTGIVEGGSGLNQTWNFTNLTKIDSSNYFYDKVSNTPYADSFPTANLASIDTGSDDIYYNFLKTTTANFQYHGQAYTDFMDKFTTPEVMLQYPFTYNSSYLDTFAGYGIFSGYLYNATGTISNIGDASGTIILPFGTYQNALRVRTHYYEYDSLISMSYIVTTSYTQYDWYVASLKFPIFTIYYDTILDNGNTYYDKYVYYCNNQPIGITKIGNSVPSKFELSQNYPNPFNPSTKISFQIAKTSFVSLIIYDLLGKEIGKLVDEELKPGIYSVNWNASNYSSGTYFYRLSANDFVQTKKMVLVR